MKMKQTMIGDGHEIIFVVQQFFENNVIEQHDELFNYAYHYCIGKFSNRFDISIEKEYIENNQDAVIFIVSLEDNNQIFFPAYNEKLTIDNGGIACFKDIVQYEITKKYKIFKFSTNPGKKVWGHGKNKYEVSCLIQDMYKVNVMADNEDEAKALAKDIEISYWDHPGYGSDNETYYRVLLRHAKWGNFIVNNIS